MNYFQYCFSCIYSYVYWKDNPTVSELECFTMKSLIFLYILFNYLIIPFLILGAFISFAISNLFVFLFLEFLFFVLFIVAQVIKTYFYSEPHYIILNDVFIIQEAPICFYKIFYIISKINAN